MFPQIEAYGRVDGPLAIQVGEAGVTSTTGALELRGASWTPGGFLDDTALRADTGSLAWKLERGRLEFTKIESSSKDFQATGSGLIRIVKPIDDSAIDIRLEVTPGETMPPLLRRYFDAFQGTAPTARGTRTFRLQGLLRDPRLVGPPGRG